MNMQSNYVFLAFGAIVILVGGYFLFRGTGEPTPPSEVATTTDTGATTTPPGSGVQTGAISGGGTAVVTQASDLKIVLPGISFKVGASVSPITMTLPAGSEGKYLVLTLKPAGTNTAKAGVLLGTAVTSDGTTYPIQGLHLSTVTDPTTNADTKVAPGTYVIEAVLWDHNPFGLGGYKNLAGNNAYGTLSAQLTVTP